MIRSLKADLEQRLTGEPACLYWSGGSDSTLLLHVLLDLKANFAILCFDHTFSAEQKKLIDAAVNEYGLRVFTYPPANAYMIGDGERISFVEEYKMLDGTQIPFIRDCSTGKRCSFDVMVESNKRTHIGFALNLFGVRKTDRHWSWGKVFKSPEVELSYGKIYAPLWDWTRKDVAAALTEEYGIKMPRKIDTGDLDACVACLKGRGKVFCPKKGEEIDSVDWQPREMLAAFRDKYGVKHDEH